MGQEVSFSKLETSRDHQYICKGCREIEMLLEVQRRQEYRHSFRLLSKAECFHSNYEELDSCARKCVTCRVLRQALVLKQRTVEDIGRLRKESIAEPIYAQLVRRETTPSAETVLKVSIGKADGYSNSARVSCTDSNTIECLDLPSNPDNPSVHQQAKRWLEDCMKNHPECGNLRWSSSYPTRLVHILSESKVELIHCPQRAEAEIEYAALSYCWGSGDRLTKDEYKKIDGGKTRKDNIQRRTQPFNSSELPVTLQDSIALINRLGIEYIWIDTVCIVQDDHEDWQHEAAMMHEVYGNACFTLCACSNEKATESLFRKREAWSPAIKPCRLRDQWITNFDVSLKEMRAQSPLASRAWTLQEERLSPRILYWSAQRMYWSCSISQYTELGRLQISAPSLPRRPFEDKSTLDEVQSSSQSFLISCRRGEDKLLHDEWLDVVDSYIRRRLSHKEDRFPALSGLASRYYVAQNGDEYLAGLWRQTFAEDLAWCVTEPGGLVKCESLREFAPSWSWASLPFCTSTRLKHNFSKLSSFKLLEEISRRQDENPTAAIKQGAGVRCIKVRGRLRPFLSQGPIKRPWTEISKMIGNEEKFSFGSRPEEPAYSIDLTSSRVLSYEARKEEVLGHLDYHEDADRADNGLLRIHCLEIGESVMLLLEQCEDNNSKYLRIGVSYEYRRDFFAGIQVTELMLV